jgi:hypothetical protein
MSPLTTINWEDGNLRLYAGERVSKEAFAELRKQGFTVRRGETTFKAAYTPGRASFLIAKYGGELEEDDTDFTEEAEDRAERYENRADKRAQESQSRRAAADRIGDMIPMGQPVLVGHYSEGRHLRDLKRIDSNMRKSFEASDKAAYWARRAKSAIRRAERRETAPAIHRRIDELEANLRRCQRNLEGETNESYRPHYESWIWFYENRLNFERALLAELPENKKPDSVALEQHGAIRWMRSWFVIERVNKKTVSITCWGSTSKRRITDILPADYMSPAEFAAADKVQERSGGYKVEGRS